MGKTYENAPSPKRRALSAYGALALPLAFVGIPIYINVPYYYAAISGLSLTSIGLALLLIRIIDTVQDPFLGYMSDRINISRKWWIGVSLPFLAVSFYGLFHIPAGWGQVGVIAWLAVMLTVVYTAFSLIVINYYALAAEQRVSYHDRTRFTGYREGVALVGVLVASVLPQVLSGEFGPEKGFMIFTLIFFPVLFIFAGITLKYGPSCSRNTGISATFKQMRDVWNRPRVKRLLYVFMLNAFASAITASLVLFFVGDVIGHPQDAGYVLGVYFLSGALAMPVWMVVAKRIGKRKTLLISMAIAMVSFVWAFTLGKGDILPFYIICAFSGIAVGVDMAIPVAILADLMHTRKLDYEQPTAVYMGIWNFISKFSMALAAGLALPLLDFYGYRPGAHNTAESLLALKVGYTLVPCVMKLLAFMLLARSHLEVKDIKEAAL